MDRRIIAALAFITAALAVFAAIPADVGDAFTDKGPGALDLRGDFTSAIVCTSEQTVIIAEDLNITGGGSVTIEGTLIVNEGITVTISGNNGRADSEFASSELVIKGDATVNGNIVSKVAEGLRIEPASNCETVINGSVSAEGDASGSPAKSVHADSGDGKVTVNGKLTIGYNAVAFIDGIVFSEGSEFRDLGEAVTSENGGMRLSGSAYFNGTANSPSGAFMIGFDSPTATVDIDSLSGTVTVTDRNMLVYSYGGAEYFIGQDVESDVKKKAFLYDGDDGIFLEIFPSFVSLTNLNNVRVSADVSTSIEYNPTYSQNQMVADENIVVAALDDGEAVIGTSSDAAIILGDESVTDGNGRAINLGSMDIEEVALTTIGSNNVGSSSTSNIVTVSGDLSFRWSDITVNHNSILDVEGLIVSDREIQLPSTDDSTGVYAAHFSQKDSDNVYTHYYTTLTRALDMDSKISMLGCMHIEDDVIIDPSVKLTTDPDSDPSVEISSGATLIIAEGAKFVNTNTIIVNGQLINKNFDQGSAGNVIAEIRVKDASGIGYSDIYAALAKAKAGDVLEAYGSAGGMILIDKDLTIPEGMALDSNGCSVVVVNGCTLTIQGKLIISDPSKLVTRASGSSSDNGWNSKTPAVASDGSVRSYSVISVQGNGTIEIGDGSSSGSSSFSNQGAYYYEDDNGAKGCKVFTSAENAFAAIMSAYDKRVFIVGDVSLDCLNVSGTEKDRITVDIVKGSKVSMNGFTFSYGTVNVPEGVELNGDIGTSSGRMTFSGAVVLEDATFAESFIDGATTLEVTGEVGSNDVTSVFGTVCLRDFKYSADRTNPYVSGTSASYEKRLLVQAGSSVSISGSSVYDDVELLVEGNLTVMKGASLKASWMSVTGTLTVARTDGVAGYLSADYLCIGGSTDSFKSVDAFLNGNAAVTGAGTFDITGLSGLFVFSGATVTADVLASWMDNTAGSTTYHINGSQWLTAYQDPNGNMTINSLKPASAGRSDLSWMTYDEKSKKYVDNVSDSTIVGKTGFDKVYTEVSLTVYGIRITADAGIKEVCIDGMKMTGPGTGSVFTTNIPEGTHSITYALADGYSGNASIMSINGKTLEGGGLKFTADKDNSVDYTVDIVLGGVHKSGDDTGVSGSNAIIVLLIVVAVIAAIILVAVYYRRSKNQSQ